MPDGNVDELVVFPSEYQPRRSRRARTTARAVRPAAARTPRRATRLRRAVAHQLAEYARYRTMQTSTASLSASQRVLQYAIERVCPRLGECGTTLLRGRARAAAQRRPAVGASALEAGTILQTCVVRLLWNALGYAARNGTRSPV